MGSNLVKDFSYFSKILAIEFREKTESANTNIADLNFLKKINSTTHLS